MPQVTQLWRPGNRLPRQDRLQSPRTTAPQHTFPPNGPVQRGMVTYSSKWIPKNMPEPGSISTSSTGGYSRTGVKVKQVRRGCTGSDLVLFKILFIVDFFCIKFDILKYCIKYTLIAEIFGTPFNFAPKGTRPLAQAPAWSYKALRPRWVRSGSR